MAQMDPWVALLEGVVVAEHRRQQLLVRCNVGMGCGE
jgi:hypothetical protein